MALGVYKPNANDVSNYLVGGIPYVTSSLTVPFATSLEVKFPLVTQFVTVRCDSLVDLRVGFSNNGISGSSSTNNYVKLASSGSVSMAVRVSSVFLISDTDGSASAATVIAGLTPVESTAIAAAPLLNWSGSAGVG